jgi:hypothetical protein
MWAVQFASMQFVAEKRGWTKFVSMQNHYNLLYREEEREMNRFCNDTGVGLIPVSLYCPLVVIVLTIFTVGAVMPRPPCAPAFVLRRDHSVGGREVTQRDFARVC